MKLKAWESRLESTFHHPSTTDAYPSPLLDLRNFLISSQLSAFSADIDIQRKSIMSGHPIIEEFDDDFDLPLPSRPLPNTGTRGAILEEISSSNSNSSDENDDASPGFARGQGQNVLESWYEAQQSTAGPASGRTPGAGAGGGPGGAGGMGGMGGTGIGNARSEYAKGAEATDISIYKKCVCFPVISPIHTFSSLPLIFLTTPNPYSNPLSSRFRTQNRWTCIYPIYIDAKQPYGTGTRRLPREKSVWWPLSKDIAEAASRLQLSALHEVHKRHPRDWDNPGRVRVQWKKDGRLLNPGIRTSKCFFLCIVCHY